jgi:hypothetical protein
MEWFKRGRPAIDDKKSSSDALTETSPPVTTNKERLGILRGQRHDLGIAMTRARMVGAVGKLANLEQQLREVDQQIAQLETQR